MCRLAEQYQEGCSVPVKEDWGMDSLLMALNLLNKVVWIDPVQHCLDFYILSCYQEADPG